MFFTNGDDRGKLMILYILRGCHLPLSRAALETALLENPVDGEEVDLLTIPARLSMLEESGFIAALTVVDMQMYFLTKNGNEVISLFDNTLPKSIREQLDAYIARHADDFHRTCTMRSDYDMLSDGSCEAKFALVESGKPIFELNISLPSAESTLTAQKRWESESSELYMQVLQWLTGE